MDPTQDLKSWDATAWGEIVSGCLLCIIHGVRMYGVVLRFWLRLDATVGNSGLYQAGNVLRVTQGFCSQEGTLEHNPSEVCFASTAGKLQGPSCIEQC